MPPEQPKNETPVDYKAQLSELSKDNGIDNESAKKLDALLPKEDITKNIDKITNDDITNSIEKEITDEDIKETLNGITTYLNSLTEK